MAVVFGTFCAVGALFYLASRGSMMATPSLLRRWWMKERPTESTPGILALLCHPRGNVIHRAQGYEGSHSSGGGVRWGTSGVLPNPLKQSDML